MLKFVTVDAKAFAAASLFQGNRDVRYYLNGVCIKANNNAPGMILYATNGAALIKITDASAEIDDSFRDSGVILRAHPYAITKMRHERNLKVSFAVILDIHDSAKDLVLSRTAEPDEFIIGAQKINGVYPANAMSSIPDELPETNGTGTVSPRFIEQFSKAAQILGTGSKTSVPIEFRAAGDRCYGIFHGLPSHLTATAVLMGLRL